MTNEELMQQIMEAFGLQGTVDAERFELLAIVMIVVALIAFAVGILIVLVAYVLQALAIMRMSQKLYVERPWLAWIPIAQSYALGRVAERCDERQGKEVKPWAKILLFAHIGYYVVYVVLSGMSGIVQFIVPILGPALLSLLQTALSLAFTVFVYICVWKAFREFYPPTVNIVVFVVTVVLSIHPITMLIASFFTLQPAYREKRRTTPEDITESLYV
ncbi:MAG: hypothetical protein E7594_06375 [Ruminococcaceae bacterium]|nr:hypothetical protein [Oscillospiraceae bacterium]